MSGHNDRRDAHDGTPIKKRIALPKMTDRLTLGETGLRVSPFCLGMVDSDDTACAAFDAGVNFFFFSADLHWPYYESARRGLAKLLARGSNIRDQIVVAVVSYLPQPDFCEVALEEGLEAVPGLKFIDVGVIGGAYTEEFMIRLQLYHQLCKQKHCGIRSVATSFHDRDAALLAIKHEMVDLAFIRYNALHPGASADLFPDINESRKTLIYNFKSTLGFVPPARFAELGLNRDYWRPKITDHYRFALTRPEIDGLLCSPTTPLEVHGLERALEAGPLDEEEEQYLIDLASLVEGNAVLIREDRVNSLKG